MADDIEVFPRFCAPAQGPPYWFFRVRRGVAYRRYVLPPYVADWHGFASMIAPEDQEILVSIAQKRPILY